jgi:hypothetical protein
MLTRRYFLRWLLGLPCLPFFPFAVQELQANLSDPPGIKRGDSIGAFFEGEELVYEISFLFFKRAAVGTVRFRKSEKKGQYIATLHGETLGIIGFVARYREDTYRATMEEVEGGSRLRALSLEEDVKIGSRVRKRTHLFDYQKRKWIALRQKRDGSVKRTETAMSPEMVYDDHITASYNFRFGVYGKIERAREYIISTFPRKNISCYRVIVASKGEEERRRKLEQVKAGKEFYIRLHLDPEITNSKTGIIHGWLSKELYPTEGVLEDAILFGDVKGTLVKVAKRTGVIATSRDLTTIKEQ